MRTKSGATAGVALVLGAALGFAGARWLDDTASAPAAVPPAEAERTDGSAGNAPAPDGELQQLRADQAALEARLRDVQKRYPFDAAPLPAQPTTPTSADGPAVDASDGSQVRDAFERALADGDGGAALRWLRAWAALGPDHFDGLVKAWTALLVRDGLGLGQLQLQAAILAEQSFALHLLNDFALDIQLRHLAGAATSNADRGTQRALLAQTRLGDEPDQRMHGYLLQPMIAMRDPLFLPQLAGLVQRANVSNNFRQLVAAGIAELPGPEAENAFTQLIASSDDGALKFSMDAFRLIHRPPVPFGLIIWNAPKKPRNGGFIMADVVTHYDGREIRTHRDLWSAASASTADDTVAVRVWRAGSEITLTIKGGTGHYNFWVARASREIRRP